MSRLIKMRQRHPRTCYVTGNSVENAASSRGFATALYIKRYAFVVDYNFGVLAAVVLSVVELAEILAQ